MILRGLVLFCRQAFSYRLGGPGIRRLRSCPGCRASLHDAISDPTLDVTAGIEISTLTLPTGLGLASIDDRALALYRRDCGLSRSSHSLRRCISLHHHAGVDGQHGAVAGLRDDRHVGRVGGNLTPPISLWKDELLHWNRGDADHVEPLCQVMRWCSGGDSLALRAVGQSLLADRTACTALASSRAKRHLAAADTEFVAVTRQRFPCGVVHQKQGFRLVKECRPNRCDVAP